MAAVYLILFRSLEIFHNEGNISMAAYTSEDCEATLHRHNLMEDISVVDYRGMMMKSADLHTIT